MPTHPETPDSQQWLASHFAYSPLAAMEFDRKGRIIGWNPAAERIFGWTASELKGKRFDILVSDSQREQAEIWWEAVVSQRGGTFLEQQNVAKGGQLIDCEWHSSALLDAHGRVFGVGALVIDKTSRTGGDEATADLEQQLAERTAELEAAVAELDAFSNSVSQELTAPLRAIERYSQALAEECRDSLPAQGVRHVQRIRATTRRMDDLINALLNLSRVSRQGLRSRSVDLSELATQVVDGLQQTDPGRKVSVQIQPGLVAHGDRELLKILLQNLLDNAWKFTQRTPDPRIVVGAFDCPSGRTYFVRDNGVGFDQKQASKLFQPFQRLHRPEEFDGHGIGLATVLRIVRKHGGQVRIEGRPSAGATGWFTLGCGLASEEELSSHEMPVFVPTEAAARN
jgi:PAS domain S-box-containing protein